MAAIHEGTGQKYLVSPTCAKCNAATRELREAWSGGMPILACSKCAKLLAREEKFRSIKVNLLVFGLEDLKLGHPAAEDDHADEINASILLARYHEKTGLPLAWTMAKRMYLELTSH